MFKICRHQYGEVNEQGYQYCTKCGNANNIGKIQCTHKWKIKDEYVKINRFTSITTAYVYILQCQLCGELKEFRSSVN